MSKSKSDRPKTSRPIDSTHEALNQLPGIGRRIKKLQQRLLRDLDGVLMNINKLIFEKGSPYRKDRFLFERTRIIRERLGTSVAAFTLWSCRVGPGLSICVLVTYEGQVIITNLYEDCGTRLRPPESWHSFLCEAEELKDGSTYTPPNIEHFRFMEFIHEIADFKKCANYLKAQHWYLKAQYGK
jgi:hypothetical protein